MEIFGSKKTMTIMTIADCHGKLKKNDIKPKLNHDIKAVFLLGDNTPDDIRLALSMLPDNIPIYGVTGNHDYKAIYEPFSRITELNGRNTELNGIIIGGISGSLRYKYDDYYSLISNEESIRILKDLPYCDILIAHDKPCFETIKDDLYDAHAGLKGIGEYILKKKPKYVLHGHLHVPSVTKKKHTKIRCCYGVEVFNLIL